MVPWNSASGGFAYKWQSKLVGIVAIKTEKTQIHFSSDVLVAVAPLDLKVPIIHDGDVNETGIKAVGLDWQDNNLARASCFFVHLFPVTARLRRENAWFHVLWETWTQERDCSFSKLRYSLRSHCTGRFSTGWKNLTGLFVHTEPFNTFALFTRNCRIVILPRKVSNR